MEEIFRKADKLLGIIGIIEGGKNVMNLRYSDDKALEAESEETLQL